MARERIIIVLGLLAAAGVAWTFLEGKETSSGQDEFPAPRTAPGVPPTFEDDAAYAGTKGCKKCHFKPYKQWKYFLQDRGTAPSACAMDSPADGGGRSCAACHRTGCPSSHDATERFSPAPAEYYCESCHGPGRKHIEFTKQRGPKAYREDPSLETYIQRDDLACLGCHVMSVDHASKHRRELDHSR